MLEETHYWGGFNMHEWVYDLHLSKLSWMEKSMSDVFLFHAVFRTDTGPRKKKVFECKKKRAHRSTET